MVIRLNSAKTKVESEREDITKILPETGQGASPQGSSYYKMLLACPREWALSYIVKLQPEMTSEALTYGLIWHLMLERYYNNLCNGSDAAIEAAYNVIDILQNADGYAEMIKTLEVMWSRYLDEYMEDELGWQILNTEETLAYEGTFTYTARLDLLTIAENKFWIVEHKTSRMLNAALMDSYQLDMQILGQVWLLRNCVDLSQYPQFGGVKINITTKQARPQFARFEVYPSERHLILFERNLLAWTQLLNYYADYGYPQALGHCSGYARGYGRCQFYEICHGQPNVTVEQWCKAEDNELPYGYKRKGTNGPEKTTHE